MNLKFKTNSKYFICLIFIILGQICFSQKIDPKRISKVDWSIDLENSNFRGLDYEGITYYVDDDLQTVIGIKKGKIIWKTNVVLKNEKVEVSSSKIKFLKAHKHIIHVIYDEKDVLICSNGGINLF